MATAAGFASHYWRLWHFLYGRRSAADANVIAQMDFSRCDAYKRFSYTHRRYCLLLYAVAAYQHLLIIERDARYLPFRFRSLAGFAEQ